MGGGPGAFALSCGTAGFSSASPEAYAGNVVKSASGASKHWASQRPLGSPSSSSGVSRAAICLSHPRSSRRSNFAPREQGGNASEVWGANSGVGREGAEVCLARRGVGKLLPRRCCVQNPCPNPGPNFAPNVRFWSPLSIFHSHGELICGQPPPRQRGLSSSFHGAALPLPLSTISQVRWMDSLPACSCLLLPRPLTYSSKLSDVDVNQVSRLWEECLKESRPPLRIAKALFHSFAVVVVVDEGAEVEAEDGHVVIGRRTVGIGRAVSDGAFVATICDVAVHPEYQRRGIGRKIVRKLVQEMKRKGPTGFAVFPPPQARRFFWMLGFRSDKKYHIMAYRGNLGANAHAPLEEGAGGGTLASSREDNEVDSVAVTHEQSQVVHVE